MGPRSHTGSPNGHVYGATSICSVLWSPSVTSGSALGRWIRRRQRKGKARRTWRQGCCTLQQLQEQEPPAHWPEQQELQELITKGAMVSKGLQGSVSGTGTHQGDILLVWVEIGPRRRRLILDTLQGDLLVCWLELVR